MGAPGGGEKGREGRDGLGRLHGIMHAATTRIVVTVRSPGRDFYWYSRTPEDGLIANS